jgi:hypothetical protein
MSTIASPAHPEDDGDIPEPTVSVSDLAASGGQLSFFTEHEELAVRGLSTGEGLFKRDPRLYRAVVRLLGQDAPIREIMRLTELHNRTIQAVREREGETIDTIRKSIGKRALRTAALAIESLEEKIMAGQAKAGELAMAAGILIDKGQVLTGGVTQRTETIAAERVEDQLRQMLEALPQAEVIEAEGVPETGMGGGKGLAIAEAEVLPEMGCKDLQSSVSPEKSGHVASDVANYEDNPLPSSALDEADSAMPGGEGGHETADL